MRVEDLRRISLAQEFENMKDESSLFEEVIDYNDIATGYRCYQWSLANVE